MMSSYETLLTDLHSYLQRDDLEPQYATFVRLAEDQHARDVRCRAMTTRVTLPGEGTTSIALPEDFLEMRSLSADGEVRQQLIQVSPEALTNRRDVKPMPAGMAQPTYYSILDTLEFDTIVSVEASVSMVYWARLPRLSETNLTNWLVSNAYGCYLFGALAEAAPYIADDDRLTVWVSMYRASVDALVDSDKKSRIGNAPRVVIEDGGLLP